MVLVNPSIAFRCISDEMRPGDVKTSPAGCEVSGADAGATLLRRLPVNILPTCRSNKRESRVSADNKLSLASVVAFLKAAKASTLYDDAPPVKLSISC